MEFDVTGISEKVARCNLGKCHQIMDRICLAMDVPLEIVTDCSRWHGRNGFMKIKGQRVITDTYAYLKNYPDSVISFHENGIYISKNFTNLLNYCNKYFPPMCYKNFKKYNQHLYTSEEDMKEAYENANVFISPQRVGIYDEGDYIRLDNLTIQDFLEQYLHYIDYEIF